MVEPAREAVGLDEVVELRRLLVCVRQFGTVSVPSVVGQPDAVAGNAFVSVSAPPKLCWYWMKVFVESSYCVSVA